MKRVNEIEIIIDEVRKRRGIERTELAIASVGAISTWYLRMNNPLSFRHVETQRLFNFAAFTQEEQAAFNNAMRRLGEKA